MKRIYLFFAIVMLSSAAFGQTDAKIKLIRRHFSWIEKQKNYQTVKLENQEFLDEENSEGAEATGYFLNGKLYKIVEKAYGSIATYTTRYYLWNDSLFFIYATIDQYGYDLETGTIDYDKTENTYQGRFYYDNIKLIRRLEKGDSDNSFDPQDLKKEAYKLFSYLKYKAENSDKYRMLTGKWQSVQDPDYILEIKGMAVSEYYDGEYSGTYRWLIEKNELYEIDPTTNDSVMYLLIKLTPNTLKISNTTNGKALTFNKIQ